MGKDEATAGKTYTKRLVSLEYARWKKLLNVQGLYRYNILRLQPGKTLDIGCGIGRYLQALPQGSVGIDHNAHSIEFAKRLGLTAYTPATFSQSPHNKPETFDTLFLSHVLEHMHPEESVSLLIEYAPLLKSNGRVIICCPQERGYASDDTHVAFMDEKGLASVLEQAGFTVKQQHSFPFPRFVGKFFTYNEFVVIGIKR